MGLSTIEAILLKRLKLCLVVDNSELYMCREAMFRLNRPLLRLKLHYLLHGTVCSNLLSTNILSAVHKNLLEFFTSEKNVV